MTSPASILLVESNPPDRAILRNRLVDRGHRVTEESDWQKGIALAKERGWDAVVLAARVDGVVLGTLIPQVTQELAWRNSLSLLVYESQHGAEEGDGDLAFQAGADGFVRRAELPALVSGLEKMLESRRQLLNEHDHLRVLQHRQKTLADGTNESATQGGVEAVMLSDLEGNVLAGDAGAGRLMGSSPVGFALSEVFPNLEAHRMTTQAAAVPLISSSFEQPGNLGPAGAELELNLVPLVSQNTSSSLKLAMVTASPTAPSGAAVESLGSSYQVDRYSGLKQAGSYLLGISSLVGDSYQMQSLRASAATAAISNQPTLITGPPGAGARTLAKAIHCTVNPVAPLEQFQAGALSSQRVLDAIKQRVHQNQGAQDSSYLLAHVDEMTPEQQAELTNLLPQGRWLLTTRKPLESLDPKLIQAVGSQVLSLPALVEHLEDLPKIASRYLKRLDSASEISEEALAALQSYPWPGNVAELRQCLQASHMMASAQTEPGQNIRIEPEDLPEVILNFRNNRSQMGPDGAPRELKPWEVTDADAISFDVYEKKAILRALDHCKGNRLACARLLRLGKSTLYRKLKRLGIETKDQA